MGVTSLYTNLPHEGGVNTACYAYEDFFLCRLSPYTTVAGKGHDIFFAKLSHDKLKLLRDKMNSYRAIIFLFIAR